MRVAVADPSRTVFRIISQLLDGTSYDLVSYPDGERAIAELQADSAVHALITSAQLGGMSGHDLCKQARALDHGSRALYIIMMSSDDDRGLLVSALDSGADDFVRKPLVAEELKARLRTAERLTTMQLQLRRQAMTDWLSGALNRRGFFEEAQRIWDGSGPVSAIMFDIDRFKLINDTHGHDGGDAVIRGIATVALAATPLVGRLGGEEFCVLLRQPLAKAMAIAETLRAQIEQSSFGRKNLQATCSFGVAEWHSDDDCDVLLRRADLALYESKARGRNRVTGETALALPPPISSGVVRAVRR
jgi:two-component system, cell cycle response regulator